MINMSHNENIIKQLYNSFREEIVSKIKNKDTNPLLWVSTVTKMMITIESLIKNGNDKNSIIVEVLSNIVDNETELGDKENIKNMIRLLVPTMIDNIILATKNINKSDKKCFCF